MTIKNGDLPAMPNITSHGIATSELELAEMLSEGRVTIGLTKREQFAMAAMQGLACEKARFNYPSGLANHAVILADALLAELEKQK